ncbi:MAG: endonuclease/exonuclease/phosphatase family protein [Litorilinea sp.]
MKLILEILIIVLGSAVLLGTVISHFAWDKWWINIISNLWQQLTIVSLVVVALTVLTLGLDHLWKQLFVGLLVVAIVYQIAMLVPYTTVYPKAVVDAAPSAPSGGSNNTGAPSAGNFQVMIANINYESEDAQGLLDLVAETDPDVLQVMEFTEWWQSALAPLRKTYAHHVEVPQSNAYGMGIYSRIPLENVEVLHLEDPDTPAIYAELAFPTGERVIFYGLHPRPPLPSNSMESVTRELIQVANRLSETTLPVIVGGDLNDVPWSYTIREFRNISGLKEVRMGRGVINSFDAHRWYFQMPLDHIFLTPDLGLLGYELLPAFGSDHYALVATFTAESAVAQPTPPE